jgi:type VI secretion system protein ImpG
MDPDFGRHYQQEQQYITAAMAGDFASRHPKIAERFGMLGTGEIADPFVQRLLQNYSAIAARSQMRIERMADPVPERTLQCVHPNYVTPLPSMAVVKFYPGYKTGQGMEGQRLPRGTELTSDTSEQVSTACVFRTSQNVVIYPLAIVFACVTGIPPDIPGLYRFVFGDAQVKGALRLRIRTANGLPIRELQGLDRLPIYLCGDPQLASRLFELIHTSTLASVTGVPGAFATRTVLCSKQRGPVFTWPARDGIFHEQFRLVDEDGETPLARRYYEIHSETGKMWSGYSDSEGLTERVYTDKPENLNLIIGKKEN